MIQFLYSSRGNWIAFKEGIYLFNTDGIWLGWFPWEDGHAVDKYGNYVGTIYDGNRLYQKTYFPDRGYPDYPGHPGVHEYPGYPGFGKDSPLPFDAEDLSLEQLNP